MTETTMFFALNPEQYAKTVDNLGKEASRTLDAIIATQKAVVSATADAAKRAFDLNLLYAKSLLDATTPYQALELQSAFAKASFDACRDHAEKLVGFANGSIEKTWKPMGESHIQAKVSRRA